MDLRVATLFIMFVVLETDGKSYDNKILNIRRKNEKYNNDDSYTFFEFCLCSKY